MSRGSSFAFKGRGYVRRRLSAGGPGDVGLARRRGRAAGAARRRGARDAARRRAGRLLVSQFGAGVMLARAYGRSLARPPRTPTLLWRFCCGAVFVVFFFFVRALTRGSIFHTGAWPPPPMDGDVRVDGVGGVGAWTPRSTRQHAAIAAILIYRRTDPDGNRLRPSRPPRRASP